MAVEAVSRSFDDVFRNPGQDFIGPIYKRYLDDDRLIDRKLNTSGFAETQDPETNLFPIEGELIGKLFDTCQKKGWSDEDMIRLLPAVHISLYAHGPQFRKSGEPYFIHPASLAIEAIEEFGADWKTAALALIHDVKEDSGKNKREVPPYLVYQIYTDLFKGENNENLLQARRDALFLIKGMEALHKVRDPKRQTHATLETLKKMCTVFLDKNLNVEDAARIMLIRLLDRRHNLRTISSLPPEKQLEKARETFLYLPFAEALHLYSLRDDLARLALQIIDPAEAEYIDSIVTNNNSLKQKYKEYLIKNEHVIHAVLEAPGFYETYQALSIDPLGNAERLKLTLVVEEGQIESGKWREIDIKVISKDQYIAEKSYFRRFDSPDFTPPVGTREEWETASIRNLEEIKERFRQAKKLRNFSDFLETTIAGQKQVYDKKGRPINLHDEDSLFDALWIRYGKEVFRGISAIIEIKGKREIIDDRDFGMTVPDGAKIVGLEIWNYPRDYKPTVQAEHIRMSRSLGVRRQLIELLEKEIEGGEETRQDVIDFGYELISGDLERAWKDELGYPPSEDMASRFIGVPIFHASQIFSSYYGSVEDVAYVVGTAQIPSSLYRRIIGELIKVRSDMICLEFYLKDVPHIKEQLDEIEKILKDFGIVSPEKTQKLAVSGETELRLWFYESQLGDSIEEKKAIFNKIFMRFYNKPNFNFQCHWNKIPVIKAKLPVPTKVEDELFKTI